MPSAEPTVRDLIDAIAAGDPAETERLLDAAPELARGALAAGASRQNAAANVLRGIGGYAYEGDTPAHIAAAARNGKLLKRLIALGGDPMARNRMGATPLHAAASGDPDAARWDPEAQAAAILLLVAEGADPNAADNNGSTPLHKAIRTRCSGAVETLLRLGADPTIRTRNGSTCERLANVSSGRGGSGSPRAKAEQARILKLLA